MKQIGIYIIRNNLNGKYYIGSSKDIRRRLYIHKYLLKRNKHFSTYLQNSWNKYGEQNFSFDALEINPVDLLKAEQFWIDSLDAANQEKGYNQCKVAGTREGSKQPESMKQALRFFMKGKPKSDAHRKAIGAGNKGKVISQETKERISESVKVIMQNVDHRNRLSIAAKCKIITEQHIQNHKDAMRKPEVRKKIADKAKARMLTDKGKENQMKASLAGAEVAKGKKYRLGILHTSETKKKMSETRLSKNVIAKETICLVRDLYLQGNTYMQIKEIVNLSYNMCRDIVLKLGRFSEV